MPSKGTSSHTCRRNLMSDHDASRGVMTGSNSDAQSWIEQSSLPGDSKTALTTFVAKFPALTFCRFSDDALDVLQAEGGVSLPREIRETLKTVAFFEKSILARFDSFEHPSSFSDALPSSWYFFRP